MDVTGISGSAFAAMAAGAHGQLRTEVMRFAMGTAGVLTDDLAAGLDALEAQSRGLTEAGLAAARSDLVGSLIDVTA